MQLTFPPVSLPMELPVPLAVFTAKLRQLGFTLTSDDRLGVDRLLRYRGRAGLTQLTFVVPSHVEDAGWLTVFGPAALEEADAFAERFPFLAPELLHRLARGGGSDGQCAWSLRMLRVGAMGVNGWSATLEASLRTALRSASPDVRRNAVAAAVGADADRGRPLVAEAMQHEPDAELRQAVQDAVASLPAAPAELPAVAGHDEIDVAARVAIPLVVGEPLARTLERIPETYARTRPRLSKDRRLHTAELRAPADRDARAVFVAQMNSRIGCAYFEGPDRVRLANDVVAAFRVYPLELARAVARAGRPPESRARALLATALAASELLVGGAHGVAEAAALVARAAEDGDDVVRSAAARAAILIGRDR